MPLLKPNEIKQLTLPSSDDLPDGDKEWVMLEVGPILGGDLFSSTTSKDPSALTINILAKRIKEWSVRGVDGNIAPITVDSLSHLNITDLAFLLNEFIGNAEAATSTDPKAIVVN